MLRNSRNLSLMPLVLGVLLTNTAVGQSLAIYRNSANKTWLEATSLPDIGYRFQTSLDYKNWEDISDAASGPLSYRIDPTQDEARFFRLRLWNTQDAPITLVMLGDSTVADYLVDSSHFSGWGQGIYEYLKSNVRAVNLAVPLQSTTNFLYSIQKDNLVTIKPDFVLIDFGWLDSSPLENWHTSLTEYEANLKTIIQIVRDFNGTPILATPTGPRYWDDQGRIIPVLVDRSQVMRNVAADSQTYLIDLSQLSRDLYNELGQTMTTSTYIASGPDDVTHFSLNGAKIIAGLVVDAFPGILRSQVVSH
jgi:lysophospholipase L1-like esterase